MQRCFDFVVFAYHEMYRELPVGMNALTASDCADDVVKQQRCYGNKKICHPPCWPLALPLSSHPTTAPPGVHCPIVPNIRNVPTSLMYVAGCCYVVRASGHQTSLILGTENGDRRIIVYVTLTLTTCHYKNKDKYICFVWYHWALVFVLIKWL